MATPMATAAARRVAIALKMRESAKFFEAGIDFGSCEGTESLHSEAFTAEAPHHGAIDDGAAKFAEGDMFGLEVEALFGEVSDEASGEAIAGAGGVEDVFEK